MSRVTRISSLLFTSGLCALIYQMAWLREMRLIFGASHAASAAVLAIFMGGLGLGGFLLGKKADQSPNPLKLYSSLEFGIAFFALLSLLLIDLSKTLYIALGGSLALGQGGAAVIRLLLSTLVLAVPTVLMGGTLPAAAKAAETDEDSSRRNLAALYGLNTLGAVTGVLLSTFYLMETFGTRATLISACLVNALLALLARHWAKSMDAVVQASQEPPNPSINASQSPVSFVFVLFAAGLVGFVFLLMELVWYRMLSPLLGGSTYTFGVILAVALLGIGLGGGLYSVGSRSRVPGLFAFAISCGLEALFMGLPFAFGDDIATLAMLTRPLGAFGFFGLVLSWMGLAFLVVFPAALISGYQFPLLVALLGRGHKDVGKQVGQAYGWNTVGAILGSLAGGFSLLPLLTAPGAWRLAVILLIVVGVMALFLARSKAFYRAVSWAIFILATLCILSVGPGPFWRHSPIGAGRARLRSHTPNSLTAFQNEIAANVRWQRDGRETSLALYDHDSFTFVINGKSDGNAKRDRETQVMGGLVGAALHPLPKNAMVIGLGTGSTAGWLGKVETIESVDVIELEPAILEVAKTCFEVNAKVLENKKVKIAIGDAREALLTARKKYDLIFSEPSNPYRAGIASLYTLEFYQATKLRLNDDGIFTQWLQGYEVDGQTVRTILATLATVFPNVEIWHTNGFDLLFLATEKPIEHKLPRLRKRLAKSPYKECLVNSWRCQGAEAFMAHFLATDKVARSFVDQESDKINTDDRNLVEYGFGRTVGQRDLFRFDEIERYARQILAHKPKLGGDLDWPRVYAESVYLRSVPRHPPTLKAWHGAKERLRVRSLSLSLKRQYRAALKTFAQLKEQPSGPIELVIVAEGLADAGNPKAEVYIEQLRIYQQGEAEAILARLRLRQNRLTECRVALLNAFDRFRDSPWARDHLMKNALRVADMLSRLDKDHGKALVLGLEKPFAANCIDNYRKTSRMNICLNIGEPELTISAIRDFEPHVPWQYFFLRIRYKTYKKLKDPLTEKAASDLEQYLSKEPSQLVELSKDR
jgi:spermidine synthase